MKTQTKHQKEVKIYLHGKHIDTVFYDNDCDEDYILDGLINHDGYNPAIKIEIMRKFKEEFTEKDFDLVNEAIYNQFAGTYRKNHRGETVYLPYDMESIDFKLGLPYTSSGIHAQIALDCNEHIYYDENYYYDFVSIDEDDNVVFVLTDDEENRIYIDAE